MHRQPRRHASGRPAAMSHRVAALVPGIQICAATTLARDLRPSPRPNVAPAVRGAGSGTQLRGLHGLLHDALVVARNDAMEQKGVNQPPNSKHDEPEPPDDEEGQQQGQ